MNLTIFAEMKSITGKRFGFCALCSLLVIMGVTYTLMYLITPYFGDDWGYMGVYRTSTGLDGSYPLWQFWLYDLRHWLHTNGRMANFLASFCLGAFPQWVSDVILGCAAVSGAALIVRLGGLWRTQGYASMSVIMVAVYALLFPWWDMMFTIDFAFNYPFTLAVVLGAVYLFMKLNTAAGGTLKSVMVIAAGAVAGCMHESASLPLLCGAVWWIWREKRWLTFSPVQRRMFIAFAAGTLLSTLSPGILLRAAGGESWRIPDDTPWVLIVKSAPITLLIFLAYGIVLTVSRRARQNFSALFSSPACVWAIAAVTALAPVAAGGIVGRSGWFSQAYALIFLCCWVRSAEIRVPLSLAVTSAAAAWLITSAQSVATVITGVEFHERMAEIDRAYVDSPDGIVFAEDVDYLTGPWWTLQRIDHRTQDMYYERKAFAGFYHSDELPVILPPEAELIDFLTIDEAEFPSGVIITTSDPSETQRDAMTVIPFEREGRRFFLLIPRRALAWGER